MEKSPNKPILEWVPDEQQNIAQLDDDRLLSRVELQDIFGVSTRFSENMAVKGGGIPMVRLGRSVRYRVADIREWIQAQRVSSTSQGAA